eukprot:TRINITY_DN37448_c0_g1_i1.p1 TRINITY_DN37448_c0_g1~~TRINITY_DN37448_c0_g1_i1.p1  ORF type:complete len:231 (+),score=68.32 TRINITY_DN37448_c0_g1_i1:50-742(+)
MLRAAQSLQGLKRLPWQQSQLQMRQQIFPLHIDSGRAIAVASLGSCRHFSNGQNSASDEARSSQSDDLIDPKAFFAEASSSFALPKEAEERRDLLRRLGTEAEKDDSRLEEALSEALDSLNDPHPLVRLAGVHTAARLAARGNVCSWQAVADLVNDGDELVRVASVRAVGRMAGSGDADALEYLQRAQKEARDLSVRNAARDAEIRVLGSFAALPGGQSAGRHLLDDRQK